MNEDRVEAVLRTGLEEAEVALDHLELRSFPGEQWVICYVEAESLLRAQALAGAIEQALVAEVQSELESEVAVIVVFRPIARPSGSTHLVPSRGLFSAPVNQLVQLLEARSRTSDALPSLKYVDDPRSSLSAIQATRHHLVFGRRGVGKTALLLEAKRAAESQGHVVVWINAHVIREMGATDALKSICAVALDNVLTAGGTSSGPAFTKVSALLAQLKADTKMTPSQLRNRMNDTLRPLLRSGLARMFIFVDDFYFFDRAEQPQLLDHLSGMLRDCDAWLKIASIERLTQSFEPSTKRGLEVPHDATVMNLDVTLENPAAAQRFLQTVLTGYTSAVGLKSPREIAKREALGRLVMGSGGVPRDYLNLFASSIVVARAARQDAREVGKEDVAVAAGQTARSKKRDLEQDVSSELSGELLVAIEKLASQVRASGFTYFRVDVDQDRRPGYVLLSQLVDLRFAHLVQQSLSDKHKPDTKYEAYSLDLSEFTDVRLKRGLNMLDLEDGAWIWRLTGKAATAKRLTGTQLRDRLRASPLIDVDTVAPPKPRRQARRAGVRRKS